jgi:hypothetical protein
VHCLSSSSSAIPLPLPSSSPPTRRVELCLTELCTIANTTTILHTTTRNTKYHPPAPLSLHTRLNRYCTTYTSTRVHIQPRKQVLTETAQMPKEATKTRGKTEKKRRGKKGMHSPCLVQPPVVSMPY